MEYGQAPLLDRLIDTDPGSPGESVQQRLMNVRQLKALVVRDLENLLNSRRDITSVPPGFQALQQSVATYGLKDFTSLSTDNRKIRVSIQKDVEQAIARFEPRLQQVKVVLKTGDQKERTLSFQIAAMLVVDPIREPVAFDTFFDATRKQYVVSD